MDCRGTLVGLLALVGLGGSPAAAQQKFTLAEVAFLTGCWAGQMGSLDMREQWTAGDGGMMQSTPHTSRILL